jgi:hypothetical protein
MGQPIRIRRLGHASPRAALIYQHATAEHDRQMADYLDGQVFAADQSADTSCFSVTPLRGA